MLAKPRFLDARSFRYSWYFQIYFQSESSLFCSSCCCVCSSTIALKITALTALAVKVVSTYAATAAMTARLQQVKGVCPHREPMMLIAKKNTTDMLIATGRLSSGIISSFQSFLTKIRIVLVLYFSYIVAACSVAIAGICSLKSIFKSRIIISIWSISVPSIISS